MPFLIISMLVSEKQQTLLTSPPPPKQKRNRLFHPLICKVELKILKTRVTALDFTGGFLPQLAFLLLKLHNVIKNVKGCIS